MSESNFQMALCHLYANIDRYDSYSPDLFEQFALSGSQSQALEDLMTSQRDGLLLFNQLLLNKRRRLIQQALPKSQEVAGAQLESFLDAYQARPVAEGARDLGDTLRSLADFAGEAVARRADPSKELEFILFEALYVSVALRSPLPADQVPRPRQLSADLRLTAEADTALVRCTYDVCAAMTASSPSGLSHYPSRSCWFFMFQAGGDKMRVLTVSPRLAEVLALFRRGWAFGEVLRTFDSERELIAASASIEKLLLAGAPFVSQRAPADRSSASVQESAG
jgi:hypothetical protein